MSTEQYQDVLQNDYQNQNTMPAPSGILSHDNVQSIEEITKSLNKRVLPQTVELEIDQTKKYTIEDVYKNEILFRQKQIIKNLERERVFIKKQVDGKVETYYKGNDTYTNLLCSELNEINELLDDLNAHKIFVEIAFSGDSVTMVAQKERQVKRDGVYKTEIAKLHKVVVKNSVLENKDGSGYKLSVEKIKANEEAFHDKQLMLLRKEKEEKQEQQPNVDIEQQQPEEKEEEQQQVEQPEQTQTTQEEVAPKPQTSQIESQGIQNIISKLGDFKGDEIFKQAEPTEDVEVMEPEPKVEENDWFLDMVDSALEEAVVTDEDYEALLGISTQKQAQPQRVETFEQNQTIKPKQEHLYLTEHDMKIRNFNIAADEVKQQIVDCYQGDEQKASQDEDFLRLLKFVEETNKKQSENVDLDQPIEDWFEPKNKQFLEQDLDSKRKAFKKRFDDQVFASIESRAH